MRNLIIAITSFFATVLIFSQIALAQENSLQAVGWADRENNNPAPTQDHDKGAAAESGQNITASVANPGINCIDGTCYKNLVHESLNRGPKCTNKDNCTSTPVKGVFVNETDKKKGSK